MFCILHSSYLTYPFKNDVKRKAIIKGEKKTKKADAARAGTFDLQICIHCAEHVKWWNFVSVRIYLIIIYTCAIDLLPSATYL